MARDYAPEYAVEAGAVWGEALRFENGCDQDLVQAIATRVACGGSITSWNGEVRTRSLAELWMRAARLASGLTRAGIRPGQVVVVIAHDALDFFPLVWACIRGGYICVPLGGVARQAFEHDRPEDLREVLAQVGDPVVVAEASRVAAVRAAWCGRVLGLDGLETEAGAEADDWLDRPAADPVLVVATSGSTGRVKLVRLAAHAVLHRNFHIVAGRDLADTRRLTVFELDSTTGLRMAWLHYSDQVHIPPRVAAGAPLQILDCVEQLSLTSIYFPTTLMTRVVEAHGHQAKRRTLDNLREVRLGSEAAVPTVARAFRQLAGGHCRMVTGYGSTETGMMVVGGDACRDDFDLGGPVAGGAMRIMRRDDDGHVLGVAGDGESGEVEVQVGQALFSGYWGESDVLDGWWRTGDRGSLRDGCLRLRGRLKDVFVARGRKHALADIEAAVASLLPAGHQVHAVTMPGDRLGIAITDMAESALGVFKTQICAVMGQRFGVQPARMVAMAAAAVPRTAARKLDRQKFGALLGEMAEVAEVADTGARATPSVLADLWHEILGVWPSPASHFYGDGGDSLASATLFAGIEARLGYRLAPEVFFRDPTFGALSLRIGGVAPAREVGPRWPLPGDCEHQLLTYVETWAGSRPTNDRLVAGLNTEGTRTPLFWVFQSAKEFAALAGALGPDQPLYGMRSGHQVMDYDEDDIQLFALRYVQDICAIRPQGDIMIGGNCQGGIIAQAVAQHLMRRRRHVPLLVLMEWGFAVQPYAGPVLVVYGGDSEQGHPGLRHRHGEMAFARAWPDRRMAEIPGKHGTFFRQGRVEALAAVLVKAMAAAVVRPPRFLPLSAQRAAVSVDLPEVWRCGEPRWLRVTVRNTSTVPWADYAVGGLSAGSCWQTMDGEMVKRLDGRAPLPGLQPGEAVAVELEVAAPAFAGSYVLVIDVVEEGGVWFHPVNDGALRVEVTVA